VLCHWKSTSDCTVSSPWKIWVHVTKTYGSWYVALMRALCWGLVFVTTDVEFLGRRYENGDTKVATCGGGGQWFLASWMNTTWLDLSFIKMINWSSCTWKTAKESEIIYYREKANKGSHKQWRAGEREVRLIRNLCQEGDVCACKSGIFSHHITNVSFQ
jgi:hypothetical protein